MLIIVIVSVIMQIISAVVAEAVRTPAWTPDLGCPAAVYCSVMSCFCFCFCLVLPCASVELGPYTESRVSVFCHVTSACPTGRTLKCNLSR